MANGGIIGPINDPITGTQSQTITAITSSNPSYTFDKLKLRNLKPNKLK